MTDIEKIVGKRNCFDCGHCQYHSEGDSYCDLTFDFVLEDWCVTDYFMDCNGKNWIKK